MDKAMRVEVENAGAALVAALNRKDVSGMLDAFAPEAVLLAPTTQALYGSAIGDFWRGFGQRSEAVHMISTKVEELAPGLAIDVGAFSHRPRGQGAEERRLDYKYVIVWARTESGWTVRSMAWNTVRKA